MRTIKFRGKDLETNEWLYGNIQVPKYPFDKYFMWDNNHNQREVKPETIGQYTGLQDKNDVEIYEGDIVRVSCVPVKYIGTNAISYIVDCICVFFQGSFLYKRISPFDKQKLSRNWTYKPMNRLDIKEVEVIGNIHDNPELLKGE